MKVSYIFHSGVAVELDTAVLIFDYYKGELPEFDQEKDIYVFSSHRHHDHFSTQIFHLLKDYPKCKYILSNDISITPGLLEQHGVDTEVLSQVTLIGKNETMHIEDGTQPLQIETLASTDEGVAFIVTYEGKVIYHAGDLNWWSWPGESEEEYETMTANFVAEMNKIEDRHFDLAFVVLDPRQEDRYWWGFDYFMRATDTTWAVPIHCWENYAVIDWMIANETSEPYRDHIVKVMDTVELK